jgi:hypothetical protein
MPESDAKANQFSKTGFKIQSLFKYSNGTIAGRTVLKTGAIKNHTGSNYLCRL